MITVICNVKANFLHFIRLIYLFLSLRLVTGMGLDTTWTGELRFNSSMVTIDVEYLHITSAHILFTKGSPGTRFKHEKDATKEKAKH